MKKSIPLRGEDGRATNGDGERGTGGDQRASRKEIKKQTHRKTERERERERGWVMGDEGRESKGGLSFYHLSLSTRFS